MSLLQEYQKHRKYLGDNRLEAIGAYIAEREKRGERLAYSDVVYVKRNWEKFDKWFKTVYNNRHGESAGGDPKVQ